MDKGVRKVYPASMSLRERDLRSKLGRLIGGQAMVRGTASVKGRSCGKSGCKCMRGEKHSSMYIAFSEGGKTHHIYVPKHRQEEVMGWVRDYQQTQELLEELSKVYLEKLKGE